MLPDFRQINVTERQKRWVSATLENVYHCQLSSLTDRYTVCVAGIRLKLFACYVWCCRL